MVETGRVSKILAFRGIERTPIDEAEAGDIVAIAGLVKFNVADTLCAIDVTEPLQAQPIDPPTLSMTFLVNDSPLAGTEGDKVTSRVIRDRLLKEAEGNVALKIEDSPGADSFIVSGRGELPVSYTHLLALCFVLRRGRAFSDFLESEKALYPSVSKHYSIAPGVCRLLNSAPA